MCGSVSDRTHRAGNHNATAYCRNVNCTVGFVYAHNHMGALLTRHRAWLSVIFPTVYFCNRSLTSGRKFKAPDRAEVVTEIPTHGMPHTPDMPNDVHLQPQINTLGFGSDWDREKYKPIRSHARHGKYGCWSKDLIVNKPSRIFHLQGLTRAATSNVSTHLAKTFTHIFCKCCVLVDNTVWWVTSRPRACARLQWVYSWSDENWSTL